MIDSEIVPPLPEASNPTPKGREGHIWSVFAIFFMNSIVLGNWIPRIPDAKALFQLSASELGIALFCVSGGTLIAFSMLARIVKRLGMRKACMVSMPLWALFIGLVPFAPSFLVLCFGLVFAGMSIGLLEVAMNTAADEVARRRRVEIMSRAHGFWSLGSLAGALMGTAFAAQGVDIATHFAIAMPIIGLVGIAACLGLPDHPHEVGDEEKTAVFQLPSRAMILLCLMPIGIMLVEGAFIDWSALFVKDVLNGGPLAIGLIYAAFSTLMAVTRLSGDWLNERFGALAVARVSAISATIGIAVFALAPNVPTAFVGAVFSGLGVAIVYPLAMTAAARRPGTASTPWPDSTTAPAPSRRRPAAGPRRRPRLNHGLARRRR